MVQEIIVNEEIDDEPKIHIDAERFNNGVFELGNCTDERIEIIIPDGHYSPYEFANVFNRQVQSSTLCCNVYDPPCELHFVEETGQFVYKAKHEYVLSYVCSVGVMLGFDKPDEYSTTCWTSPIELYWDISKYPPIFDLDTLMN